MVKLQFNSTQEFESLFKSKKVEVTRGIVAGIEKAVLANKRTAPLFEITFQDSDRAYEISLPRSQWAISLESCLQHFHELESADEAIDTWKLLEAVKTFN